MSRFKRIKNKSNKKSSVSIDEKIDALNKELKKTGMLSEKMTTSNVYSTSELVPYDPGGEFPVPDPTGVTGSGFTQPVSGDPDDPSNWPNAYTDNSWMRNPNDVNGESNRPIIASFDDALFATDTSGRYPTGGAGIAFGNQAFGVSVGYIRNGFYRQVLKPGLLGGTVTVPQDAVGAPHFGLFGEYFPADETRQKILKMASARYAAVNVAGATTIPVKAWTPHNNFHMGPFADYSGPKVTVDGQNYVLQTFQMYTKSNTYHVNPTPEHQTNVIVRGIGDINYHGPITPGRLFRLSNQGYNYLDNKSRRRLRGRTRYVSAGGGAYPTTGRTTTFTTGSRLRPAQPVADPTTTTQTQQSPPENTEPPNIPAPQSPPDKPFTTPNPTPPPNIPPLPAPKTQPGNYEGRGGRILDPTGLDSRAIELGYNDELYPVNPNRYYTTQVELAQEILDAEMQAAFYGALSKGYGVSPDYNTASINKAKARLAKARENQDNWNRWKQNTGYMWRGSVKDTAYDQQKAAEKDLKDTKLQNQIDKLKADQAIADAAAEVYASEARALLVKFGFDVALNIFGGLLAGKIMTLTALQLGKIPAVANFFKLSKAQQAARIAKASKASSSAAKTAKTGNLSSALRGAADDIIDNLDDIIMKTDSSQALKFKDALIDAVDAGDEQAIRKIVQQIKNSKFKNQVPTGGVSGKINVPKKPNTSSEFGRPQGSMGGGYDPGADYGSLVQSYEVKGKLLNEATKLGHFEPEELNVDIEKLRKGIMPEYPKKPPAKMVDGYHQNSKLKPKELNKEPYLKIDEKDLIRNHRLKPNEAQEMMQTIDRINDHIKEHPEDLIHAQMRYPIDDPRLAELNWRMDQMLDAGEEYLDSNFKENKKLFKRATEHTLKNIKVTDPKYVQQKYDELRGTIKPKKTKLVGRLGKHLNKYESKSLFKHVNSKDFKKISERKLEKEKFLEKQEQERLDYINDINAEMDEFRSDWRNELKEQPAFKAVPIDTAKMTSSQSFAVFTNFGGDDSDTGLRFSIDGGLGLDNSGGPNIFQYPTEAGGTVPAIDFSTPEGSGTAQISLGDFPLSGYAMPLGGEMYRSITQRKKEEINKELDSSEEYTKQIKADALMKARVGDGPAVVKIYKASDFTPGEGLANTYSPEQLQKLSVQNPQKFSEYKHISDISDEMTKKVETSFEKIDQEYSDQWEPKLSSLLPSNQYSDLYKKHGGSAFNEVNIEINRLNYEEHKAMTRVKTKDGIKLRSNKKSNAIRATANKISDAIPTLQELQNKLDDIRQSKMDVVEAENRRETKALQKAAPKFFLPHGELKPLPMYMGLKASDPYGMIYDLEGDDSQTEPTTEPTTNKVSQEDEEWLNSQSTLVDFLQYLKPLGIPSDFGKFGIQYARGDDTPIKKFSGGMNKALEGIFIKKYKKNPELFENGKKVKFDYNDYGTGEGATIIQKGIDALRYPNIRLGLGTFVMSVDSNGVIRVEDTFNVDKLFTTVGAFDVFDLQNSANRITKIAHQRRGVVGDDDKGGIPVDVKFRSLKMKKLLQKKDK